MNNEKEKYDRARDFLIEKNIDQAEIKFIEFLLSFPDSVQGEDEIFSYFCNNLFYYYDQVTESKFIKNVLRALGDMKEDGGSHEYQGIIFWRQVRNVIIECRDAKDKFSKWKSEIMKHVIEEELSREAIENYYR